MALETLKPVELDLKAFKNEEKELKSQVEKTPSMLEASDNSWDEGNKKELMKENFPKLWKILINGLNTLKITPEQRTTMKNLLAKANKGGDIIGHALARRLSSSKDKEQSAEEKDLDAFKSEFNLAFDGSIQKEFGDMTDEDKINVLFGAFPEALIVRTKQEKMGDLSKISDEDFDKSYKNILWKMREAYQRIKEKNTPSAGVTATTDTQKTN